MKLTKWYDGSQKPAYVGVYQKDIFRVDNSYSYWNGKFWGQFAHKKVYAYEIKDCRSSYQSAPWRGIQCSK